MNRRNFMGSILALGAAPAIVRADSLMRVISRDQGLYVRQGECYTVDIKGFDLAAGIHIGFSRQTTAIITLNDGRIVQRPIVRIR